MTNPSSRPGSTGCLAPPAHEAKGLSRLAAIPLRRGWQRLSQNFRRAEIGTYPTTPGTAIEYVSGVEQRRSERSYTAQPRRLSPDRTVRTAGSVCTEELPAGSMLCNRAPPSILRSAPPRHSHRTSSAGNSMHEQAGIALISSGLGVWVCLSTAPDDKLPGLA